MHPTPYMQDMHQETIRSHDRISPMVDFGMVGGSALYKLTPETTERVTATPRDTYIMATAYSVCKELGIPVGAEPQIDLINLNYGRDFLKTKNKYHVVIGAFIYYQQKRKNNTTT